jgi:hypothetical protein
VADVRSLIELSDMEREYENDTKPETLELPAHLVQFQSREMVNSIDAYLRDAAVQFCPSASSF